jgi:hypothetical protein
LGIVCQVEKKVLFLSNSLIPTKKYFSAKCHTTPLQFAILKVEGRKRTPSGGAALVEPNTPQGVGPGSLLEAPGLFVF